MAIINLDYYCGEDKYSDGDVEDYLKDLVERQIDIKELPQQEKTYPVLYHLSHLRENIINWYPIQRNQTVLEIGSGCGAITRALCNKAKKVVSVELSKKRAEINYKRNIDADNLTIYVGNQNDIQFEEKFDYVLLNGVFEYAMSFTEGEDPYRAFLEKIKTFLKKDGKILIAIENRLGLKYFTGAAEDHTGNYFLGLNRYAGNSTVRTFSKSEWKKLLDACSLKCKFYYPYPDYKFPTEIFTDESLIANDYGKQYYNLDEKRYAWLDEHDMAKSLADEGVLGTFANSFFLEISVEDHFANVVYSKLSCDRRRDMRIITSILCDKEQKWVEKKAANEESISHIKKVHKNSTIALSKQIRNLPGHYRTGVLSFPFLTENTLCDRILNLLIQGEVDQAKQLLGEFFDNYFAALRTDPFEFSDAFSTVFGSAQVAGSLTGVYDCNIDLIFENLFCKDNGYQIIDTEWVFDFAVPRDFVIWRAVDDFFNKYPTVDSILQKEALLEYLHVNVINEDVYRQWNMHFAYQWLRANVIESFAKPVVSTNMDYMVSLHRANTLLSCCMYYDCGSGYSENNKLYKEIPIVENCFTVVFDLSKLDNLKALRFDPIEGKAIYCWVESECAEMNPMNAYSKDNEYDVFLTGDPMYEVIIQKMPANKQLIITGKIIPMETQQVELHFLKEREEYSRKIAELETELANIYQSKTWKMMEYIRNRKK